jgi:hypothetical protein
VAAVDGLYWRKARAAKRKFSRLNLRARRSAHGAKEKGRMENHPAKQTLQNTKGREDCCSAIPWAWAQREWVNSSYFVAFFAVA